MGTAGANQKRVQWQQVCPFQATKLDRWQKLRGFRGGTRFKDPGEKYFAAQANGCWQSQKARKDPIFTRNREPQTSESGKKPKKIEGFSSFLNRSVQKRIFRPSTFRRCPFCSFGFIFGQNSAFISVLVNKKNPFFFGFCNRMALVFCLCVCARARVCVFRAKKKVFR